jgi:hypothetical protein
MWFENKTPIPSITELLDVLLKARERRVKYEQARVDESVAEINLAQYYPRKTIAYKGYLIRINHVYKLRSGSPRAHVEVDTLEKVEQL